MYININLLHAQAINQKALLLYLLLHCCYIQLHIHAIHSHAIGRSHNSLLKTLQDTHARARRLREYSYIQ